MSQFRWAAVRPITIAKPQEGKRARATDENIFGLDVTMDDELIVQISHTVQDRHDNLPSRLLVIRTLILHTFVQLSACSELEHAVKFFAPLEPRQKPHDVWVME
jgi:hypothetical protein